LQKLKKIKNVLSPLITVALSILGAAASNQACFQQAAETLSASARLRYVGALTTPESRLSTLDFERDFKRVPVLHDLKIL
jgi:hypothetical protein